MTWEHISEPTQRVLEKLAANYQQTTRTKTMTTQSPSGAEGLDPVQTGTRHHAQKLRPKTHRIGWDDITEIARGWDEIKRGNHLFGLRRIEDALDAIDGRWRGCV